MKEPGIIVTGALLIILSIIILRSIAPFVFPIYIVYLIAALTAFVIFSKIDFDVLTYFSHFLYIFSVVLLILPLLIGQVTRGAVRWIPIGSITIQPAEIVRPFILLFFANYLGKDSFEKMNLKRLVYAFALLALPLGLILVQPSLGVSVLTFVGFVGVVLALNFNKKILLSVALVSVAAFPLLWFILAPYQKSRVMSLISPAKDPYGAGYNSIQSMISVGSGKLFGRGLGEGVQTQLQFLPEKHTDFIFAAIAEEMGFIGAAIVLILSFFLLYRIVTVVENSKNFIARAFASGVFLTLFLQVLVHIGMNMGIFPITGLTLPLVSYGGSSLLATGIMLGMVVSAKK